MLTELRAGNYKSLRDPTSVPLKQINILLGKNNSGKTALARLPLLTLSALSMPSNTRASIDLRVRDLVYASSILELAYGRLPHAPIDLGATIESIHDHNVRVDYSVQQAQSLRSTQGEFITYFSASPLIEEVRWVPDKSLSDRRVTYNDPDVEKFRGALPVFASGNKSGKAARLEDIVSRELDSLVHIRSTRAPAQAIYENRPPGNVAEASGREAPYILRSESALAEQVSRWYGNQLKLPGLSVDSSGSAFTISFSSSSGEGPNMARVGQGVQQVLPVATYLCAMKMGLLDVRFLAIEEPELHLHPAAHGAVADLIVDAVEDHPRNQVLIETHSENLVLRLRRHVAEGRISPNQLNILWFDYQPLSGTSIRQIGVRVDGSVSSWPQGVFSEDLKEVQGILQAGRR